MKEYYIRFTLNRSSVKHLCAPGTVRVDAATIEGRRLQIRRLQGDHRSELDIVVCCLREVL